VTANEIFTHPVAIGFYIGSVFTVLALYNYIRLKGELARFRRHLSDKLEIEADTMKKVKQEQETLRKENESLRVKVNALNEIPDRKVQRDIEVYARAEKRLLLSVPGFAPAWETAKTEAQAELAEEEAGRASHKRIFARIFGGTNAPAALPGRDEARAGAEGDNGHKAGGGI
jgi:cell division protein FtsB